MSIILEKLDKDIVDTKKTIRDIQQDSANLPMSGSRTSRSALT